MPLLVCWPLEAESVSVGIFEPQLLHPIRRNFGFFQIHPMVAQVPVSGIEIFAAEKQAGILIGRRRAPGREQVGAGPPRTQC
jgi:hypothetical protein